MNRDEWVYLVIDTVRWAERGPASYTPREVALGPVPLHGPADIDAAAQPLWDAGKKPVLLILDPTQAGDALADGAVVGAIPLAAVVRAAPLRPDGTGGFLHRDPTPVDHTLYGVLTRIQLDDRDPALRWKVDQAYGRRMDWVRSRCAQQLRGFPQAAIDDVAAEVVAESWNYVREKYRPDASFKAFLGGIALNKCRAARRKRRDEMLGDDELLSAMGATQALKGAAGWLAPPVTVLDALEAEERDNLVAEAAAAVLDALDQDIALLRYRDDLPFEDIARLKGIEVKDVHAAMMRIRRHLGPELRRRLAAMEPPKKKDQDDN